MKTILAIFITLCLIILVFLACAPLLVNYSIPVEHPAEVSRGETCLDCHETESDTIVYERYSHNIYFSESHGQISSRDSRVCDMCHKQSFCNDCHVTSIGLKPSIKRQSETYRRMLHRGDYLSRHRIDGRIEPISCFRCHGNPKSSKTCVRCHG
ncbi:MAG: cytochrome C [Deltaproteobacteria bacterium]|nr:cytochrome C [Deltaproteobacteria bacterium]MBW2054076.1 cytochrome C [Deltaproteobacteria bacterium]MBW2141432.1 cytochrome C [Deltaproteobacteria bacterium]MBW2324767.1 cytochrome C [Deltaproteobacteria bacterium]